MTSQSISLSTQAAFGIENSSLAKGIFYPVLYGVASGTYALAQDYGIGRGLQPAVSGTNPVDYNIAGLEINGPAFATNGTTQLAGITRCNWSSSGNVVTFDLSLSIKGVTVDPFVTGAPFELKVKSLDLNSASNPPSYGLRSLPVPDASQDSPWFEAEFVNTQVISASAPTRTRYVPTGTTDLRARLLKDGTFSLYTVSNAALQTDTAYLSTLLFSQVLNVAGVAEGANLRIRGQYFT